MIAAPPSGASVEGGVAADAPAAQPYLGATKK